MCRVLDIKFGPRLNKYQKAQLVDYMVRVCLEETVKSPSKMAVALCIPTCSERELLFPCLLASNLVLSVLDFGLPNWCLVVPHCLNFRFPDDVCEASFHLLS